MAERGKDLTQPGDQVIHIDNANKGVEFFSSLNGEQVIKVTVVRLPDHDVVTLVMQSGKSLSVVVQKDHLIAVDLNGDDGTKAILALQEDVRPRRLDIPGSVDTGQNVVYIKDEPTKGAVLPVDPAAEFSELLLDKPAIIKQIRPSWYTEDHFSISLEDWRSIVIRGDRHTIDGVILPTAEGINYILLGSYQGDLPRLGSGPTGALPARFIPPTVK